MSSGSNAYGSLLSSMYAPLDDPDGTKEQLAKLQQQQSAPQIPPMIARGPQPTQQVAQSAPPPQPPPGASTVAPAAKPQWQDMLKQAVQGQMESAQGAQNTVEGLAAAPSEQDQLGELQAQRTAAAAPLDPNDPQYRPSTKDKWVRGLKAAVQGLAQGGILGAAAGPVLADYKAPNRQYGIDTDRQAKNVASLDEQIKEGQKAYEDTTGRAKGIAQEQRGVSTAYGDVATGITNQENREQEQQRNAETLRHNQADENEKNQKDQQTTTNEQQTRKQEDQRIAIEGARLKLDRDKFNRENAASGEDDPRRQPMIDEATQKVKDLEDRYTYDNKSNMYEDSKTGQQISPQQFTDLKNDVGAKLDQQLSAKKMKPLNVRFDVKDAQGSQYQQKARPQVGKPITVDGKQHMVIGWNDKTNKPIVDRNPIG